MSQKDRTETSEQCSEVQAEKFARYDLRLRSLDRQRGEPFNFCCTSGCSNIAEWSVWLHTPDWGDGNAGETYVRCNRHALILLEMHANRAAAGL